MKPDPLNSTGTTSIEKAPHLKWRFSPSCWLGHALLIAAICAAYSNTLQVPFVFDDASSIVTNASAHRLWPITIPFSPPPLLTVSGRPLVNFSLALNYAMSGTDPWSFHVVNVLIHLAAAFTLAALLRRTFATTPLRDCFGGSGDSNASRLALAMAGLWALHPLQTESVTYVVQRTESLMSLGCLLTLYAFARGVQEDERIWMGLALIAGVGAVASKEVAAAIPLLVLLYDRTFLAGTFRTAWKKRRWFYVALASTWLLLAWLVLQTHARGGSAGFSTNVSSWHYSLTQTNALWVYLRLAVWPNPLIFDYGTDLITNLGDVWLPALGSLVLVVSAAWALRTKPVIGFLGTTFFVLLAPTTSVMPVASQTLAEHRMYLPLATLVVLAVAGLHGALGKRTVPVIMALASVYGVLTWERNQFYRHDLTLWQETARVRPLNARAHYNVGFTLAQSGRAAEAITSYERAIALDPFFAEAHANLAGLLLLRGRATEALEHYEVAARIDPDSAEGHDNLGSALVNVGRIPEAILQYEEALRLQPNFRQIHNHLGIALARIGRAEEGLMHVREAIRLHVDSAEAHANEGSILLQLGRTNEAIAALTRALEIDPRSTDAHGNLALALLQSGRFPEAAEHYRAVLLVAPNDISAHNNLGFILLQTGFPGGAVEHYLAVAQLQPSAAIAQYNLGVACERAERWQAAASALETSLRLKPDNLDAQRELGRAHSHLPP